MQRWFIWGFLLLCAFSLGPSSPAQQQPKVALLIGNKDYNEKVGPLKNPLNDIKLVGEALTEVGFNVLKPIQNGTRDDMLEAVHELGFNLRKLGKGAIGFLYYTGHGISVGNENLLIPVNATDTSERALSVRGVKLTDVLDILKREAPDAVLFVVLDACRNTMRGHRGAKGFVPLQDQRTGVVIAYATAAGETASDDGPKSGPYADALAAEIVKPGRNDQEVFNAVRMHVHEQTRRQIPWTHDGLVGDRVIFRPDVGERVIFRPDVRPEPAGPTELAFWSSVRDSKDPAILQMYLDKFPNGTFAELAKLMISQVRREADQRTIQTAHEAEARQAQIAKQEAESQRIEAERRAREAEATKQQDQLRRALEEARLAREALQAAERDRKAAEQAADEARRSAEALKSEREAQTEAARKWATAKDSNDLKVLEAFIKETGDTIYGAIARARVQELKRQQIAVAQPKNNPDVPHVKDQETQKKAEVAAQEKAEDTVRQRLAMLQKQQAEEKRLADLKASQRPQPHTLGTGVVRAKLSSASVLRSVAVSPTGIEMAIAADDGVIRIVDLKTFRVLRHLPEKSDGVTTKSVAYSGDGSLLIAGRYNGQIQIWNTSTGSRIDDLKSVSGKVYAVAYYPPELDRYVVTAGSDGVEIWNMKRKAIAGRPGLHSGSVRTLAYSFEKSGIFVSGGEDGQVIFYLPGNRQKPVQGHRGGVFATAFSADNNIVVTAGADALIKVWNAKTQTEQRTLQGHNRYVLSVALSTNATRIASGGADKSVRIWSIEGGKPLHVLEGHEKDVEQVAYLPGDNLVASVSEDKTMRIWDVVHGRQLLTGAFYPDGDYVVYDPKGRYVGAPGAGRRLEIGTDDQPRSLTDAEQHSLVSTDGFGIHRLAQR